MIVEFSNEVSVDLMFPVIPVVGDLIVHDTHVGVVRTRVFKPRYHSIRGSSSEMTVDKLVCSAPTWRERIDLRL